MSHLYGINNIRVETVWSKSVDDFDHRVNEILIEHDGNIVEIYKNCTGEISEATILYRIVND